MRLPEEPDLPPRIDIVPAIDVIFAVLAFFILSALYLTPSQGLPVNLPQTSDTEIQPPSTVTVSIDSRGQLAVNLQPVELDMLETVVRSHIGATQNPLIEINADEATTHGQVVAVLEQLRLIEGVRLGFKTQLRTGNGEQETGNGE